MHAYDLIQAADHMLMITKQLFTPLIDHPTLPENIKTEALVMMKKAEMLSDQIAECPNYHALQHGLADVRDDVQAFIEKIKIIARS